MLALCEHRRAQVSKPTWCSVLPIEATCSTTLYMVRHCLNRRYVVRGYSSLTNKYRHGKNKYLLLFWPMSTVEILFSTFIFSHVELLQQYFIIPPNLCSTCI